MLKVWLYALGSVFLVSLISLIGIWTLAIKGKILNKILIFFVSLSAGALLGGAFIHLIPEGLETFGITNIFFIFILIGILLFFILEKLITWHHCHDLKCKKHHPKTIGPMIIIGDSLHNFIDGLIIGGSFLINIPLGIATTIAVILHEIPQEIGDFGVLIHAGYSKKKALLLNFLSALTAIIGTVVALTIGAMSESFIAYLLPFAAGGFIYIAASDLIPELHKDFKISTSILQVLVFILGIALMYILTLF
jgi:zinc and cadmium transporter